MPADIVNVQDGAGWGIDLAAPSNLVCTRRDEMCGLSLAFAPHRVACDASSELQERAVWTFVADGKAIIHVPSLDGLAANRHAASAWNLRPPPGWRPRRHNTHADQRLRYFTTFIVYKIQFTF
ncbi:hypothetical protein MPTK1_3g02520 [Marchantia polymorpha subsp. ruderalis]|uniref:Uncharacterized protein n=2 Tax=Marchantia polymorpha TaxID=3197 RepID=A0AAF6AWQ7_MARPO|nr:hypothetical protein MARPO_0007s0241 [Marchantia polymorpha]BBN04191.1 hypothetical protein Mp_3g02520 [Marchantia polymorpha subsp. ruderalis]|eukprot:PTQ47878.1 hypothetical protein MARPO_0007s0241 [Marchantia polymorpha]